MKSSFFVFFIFTFLRLNAQINISFVKHLDEHKLYKEELCYLNELENKNAPLDSVHYLYAKLFLKQEVDSLFFKHYILSENLFNTDTSAIRYASYYFLRHKNSFYQNLWFNKFQNTNTNSINFDIINFYNNPSLDINSNLHVNPKLINDINYYRKLNKKNPYVAGALSAAVPGLGKLYGKQPSSAFVTFFSHCIYAAQSIESIKKFGIKNGFSIFSVSFFSLFYMSNIYGSYHDLNQRKKQYKKQLLLDAEKYMHINYPADLY